MLTPADQALWEDFLAVVRQHIPALEADDMVPVVLVCARVHARSDDAALVGVGPGDVTIVARPDVVGYDLATMLETAAGVARARRPG